MIAAVIENFLTTRKLQTIDKRIMIGISTGEHNIYLKHIYSVQLRISATNLATI